MIDFLAKRFIQDRDQVTQVKVRSRYGILCSLLDLVVVFILGISKLSVGWLINSMSLVSSGVAALVDTVLNFVTMIGFKIMARKDNDKHPFGFARAEYVTGLLMSFIIFVIGLELAYHAIMDIFHPKEILKFQNLTFCVLTLDICGNLYRRYINKRVGDKIKSVSLHIAEEKASHDFLTTLAILAVLMLNRYTGINIDAYMGLFISLTVFYTSYCCGRKAASPLLGRLPSKEFTEQIRQRILSYPNVHGIHELMIHTYGEHRCFISAHVEFPDSMLKEEIVQQVCDMEQDFQFEHRYLILHVDLVSLEDPVCNKWKQQVNDFLRFIDPISYISDIRRMEAQEQTFLMFTLYATHALLKEHPEIRNEISQYIREQDAGMMPVIALKMVYA